MDYLVDWFSNETLLGLPLDNFALALVAGFSVVVEASSDALDTRPEPARPQAAPSATAARPRPRMVLRPEPG